MQGVGHFGGNVSADSSANLAIIGALELFASNVLPQLPKESPGFVALENCMSVLRSQFATIPLGGVFSS